MPDPENARWDTPGLFWDMPGLRYDSPPPPGVVPIFPPLDATPIPLNTSNMEYWEVTKARAQATLPVWQTYVPTLKIGTLGTADLNTLIGQFEPAVQLRTAAQDDLDAAAVAVQTALLKMKLLGTKVAAIIEGHLDENAGLMKDVDDLYAVNPRTESSILKRARMLYPVWVRANTAMAALTPAQPAITRAIQGVPHTVVMLKALLDGYTDLIKTMEDKEEVLNQKREALRVLDRQVDQLNKRWYKVVKADSDPGSAVYEALSGIPTEPSTPVPDAIEIDVVSQGGEEGRQVLVSYVASGGDHATTKQVQWQVVGTDADFTNTAPLDASGNALGPFPVGKVVKVRTLVSNSAGTRTTAPRTFTVQEPIV